MNIKKTSGMFFPTIYLCSLLTIALSCSAEIQSPVKQQTTIESKPLNADLELDKSLEETDKDTICQFNGRIYKAGEELSSDFIISSDSTLKLLEDSETDFFLSTYIPENTEHNSCQKTALICTNEGEFKATATQTDCNNSCFHNGRKFSANSLISITREIDSISGCEFLKYTQCNNLGKTISVSKDQYCENQESKPTINTYVEFVGFHKGVSSSKELIHRELHLVSNNNDLNDIPGLENVKLPPIDFDKQILIGVKSPTYSNDFTIQIEKIILENQKIYVSGSNITPDKKTCLYTQQNQVAFSYVLVDLEDVPENISLDSFTGIFTNIIKECNQKSDDDNTASIEFKTLKHGSVSSSELADGDYLITSENTLKETLSKINQIDLEPSDIDFNKNIVLYGQRTFGGPVWQRYTYKTITLDSKEKFPQDLIGYSELTEFLDVTFFKPHVAVHLIVFPKPVSVNEGSSIFVTTKEIK